MLVRHGGCRAGLQRDCSERQGVGPSHIAHVFGETTGGLSLAQNENVLRRQCELGDQQMEAFHGHFQCIRSWEEVWGRLRNRSAEKASPRRRKAVDEAQRRQHAEMVRTDCARRR